MKKLFAKWRQVTPKGFTPITSFEPEDIFIAGYPKSGNTWFQELISAVVYGVLPAYCPARLLNELVPDVQFNEIYKRYRTPMYFKTHHLPRPEYKRVVYLLRDGRDAMVSYFHYSVALSDKPTDFMRMVRDGEGLGGKWHEHVKAWQANPHHAAMITIKYEDLKKNTTDELVRFCEFTGLQRDRKFLEEMGRETAFEKMQSKEAKLREYVAHQWPEGKLFHRRGKVGSYRDEMPPEVLEAFLAQAGDTLKACGYL